MIIRKYQGKTPVIPESVFVAENAAVIGNVVLGENVNVWYGAVIRGDEDSIVVGENTNVQDNASLHVCPGHPLNVGKNVTIGHNAIVHGCTVGDDSMIGMGACVLNGAVIGTGCLVAAGALVKEGQVIPDYSLCVGVPAKIVRTIDQAQRDKVRHNAEKYVVLAQGHKD